MFLPTGVFVAHASDRLEPRLAETFQAGYTAIDRYVYGDLTIDVIYLNPKVYYNYGNAYVVPFNYIYIMPEPLPHHVFKSVAASVVQRLRAIGVRADYAIVDGYTLIDRDSGEGLTSSPP